MVGVDTNLSYVIDDSYGVGIFVSVEAPDQGIC